MIENNGGLVIEKTGEKKKENVIRLIVSAVLLVAAGLLREPVSSLLDRLTTAFDWTVPFRLVGMIAALILVSAVCGLFFEHWAPKSSKGKTVYTLANSTIRYVLVLVGLLWGLAILGVDVNALLAGAGVVALIIGFGAESLIADVITGIFMLFEYQYEVGDIIVVDDFRGTVTQIGIRTTSITDTGGNVKIINNSDIRNLINRSTDSSVAVCDLGVLYDGAAVRRAEEVLAGAINQIYKDNPELFTAAVRWISLMVTQSGGLTRYPWMNREGLGYAWKMVR